MSLRLVSAALAACFLSSGVIRAATGDRVLEIRAVVHDPLGQAGELFVPAQGGGVVKLELGPKALPKAQRVRTVKGSLVLLRSEDVDPAAPGKQLAAAVRVPPKLKRAIAVVFIGSRDSSKGNKILLFDDSSSAFPKGSSRLVNATSLELGIEAGEHKLGVKPWKTLLIPPVTRKDSYNMAQTSVFYRKKKSWVAFVERKLKYIDTAGRIEKFKSKFAAGYKSLTRGKKKPAEASADE